MPIAGGVRVGVKSQRKLVSISVVIRRDQVNDVRKLPNFSSFCRSCIEEAVRSERTEFPAPKHAPRVTRSAYLFVDQAMWIRRNKINRSALVQFELDAARSREREREEAQRKVGRRHNWK